MTPEQITLIRTTILFFIAPEFKTIDAEKLDIINTYIVFASEDVDPKKFKDRTNRGIFVDLDSSADGDASNEHRIHGIESDVRFTGFSDVVRAGQFYAESGNITEKTAQLVGVYGQAIHDANSTNGGVSNMYGVYGYSQPQDLGDVDNAFGGYFLVDIGTNRGNADIGVTKGVEGEISINKANTITYGEMMAVSGVIDNNEGTVPNFGNQYLFKGDYQGAKGSNAWGSSVSIPYLYC